MVLLGGGAGGGVAAVVESVLWLVLALLPCCHKAERTGDRLASLLVVLQVVLVLLLLFHREHEQHERANNSESNDSNSNNSNSNSNDSNANTAATNSSRNGSGVLPRPKKAPRQRQQRGDGDGRGMGAALVPTLLRGLNLRAPYALCAAAAGGGLLLLRELSHRNGSSSSSKADPNSNNSSNNSLPRTSLTFLAVGAALALLLHSDHDNDRWWDDAAPVRKTISFAFLWWGLHRAAAARWAGSVVTAGEAQVVSSLLAAALTEWVAAEVDSYHYCSMARQQQQLYSGDDPVSETIAQSQRNDGGDHRYARVAAAGLVGCAAACALVEAAVPPQRAGLRLAVAAAGALGAVELGFRLLCWDGVPAAANRDDDPHRHHQQPWLDDDPPQNPYFYYHAAVPRCLVWIFGEFLPAVEAPDPVAARVLPAALLQLPRAAWLVYWCATLAVTVPLAPSPPSPSAGGGDAVRARKWFHGIAVLLFVPVTVAAPQLMALSYAVALALLLVLESTRRAAPRLNDWYHRYADAAGKGETAQQTLVSHTALIAGCAVPLWMTLWLENSHNGDREERSPSSPPRLLLSLWGVWVTGVGDAMGAVVGKTLGRRRWGPHQPRTVEGSLAMLVSLCAVCAASERLLGGEAGGDWRQWLPVCVFCTLLEAFTLQLDNLVLPLAGAAMLLYL